MQQSSGKEIRMKKFLTGVVCGAAILAAAVVFLPVTAVKIAELLSEPKDRSKRRATDLERNDFTNVSLKEQSVEKGG